MNYDWVYKKEVEGIKKKRFKIELVKLWFISYIIVLILPLLVNYFLFLHSRAIIEEEVTQTRSGLLKQLQGNIDEKLFSLRRTAVMVANDSKVINVIKASKDDKLNTKRYEILQLIKYIELIKVNNTSIDNILLYLDDTNSLFYNATFMKDDYAFKNYANKDAYKDYEKWINHLEGSNRSNYIIQYLMRDTGLKEDYISFVMSLPFGTKTVENDNLFISISKDKIVQALKDYKLSNAGVIYILDEKNNIIATSDPISEFHDFTYNKLNTDGSVSFGSYNNKETAAIAIKSSITDWKYVVLTETDVFSATELNYTRLVMIATLINLSIGIILAFEFSKRNYKPVKKIISMVSEKYDQVEEIEGDGYGYLQKGFEKAFFKLDRLEEKVQEQNNLLRRSYINRLLSGEFDDQKAIEASLRRFDIYMQYDVYSVIIVDVNIFERDKDKKDLVPLVKIAAYFQALESGNSNMFYVVQNNRIVIITNSTKEEQNNINLQLHEWVEKLLYEMSKVLKLKIEVAVSDCHHSVIDLSVAYQESLSCLEYMQKYETESVMFYEEIQSNQSYYYPLSEEQKLINHIKNGDENSAKALLQELYDRNFKENNISTNLGKSLIFDMSASVLKSIGKLEQKNIIDQDKELLKIISSKNIDTMQKEFESLLIKVCKFYDALYEEERTTLISTKINAYIEIHYKDSDLNVSKLAEHFQLTPSYLTKLYKSETNQSILKTINQIRIKYAKELLITTSLSMNEIAKEVGILHDTSFNRIFKSIENITPGQYRRINAEIVKNTLN